MKSLRVAVLSLVLGSVLAGAAAASTEYIVVSGGVSLTRWEKYKAQPHDRWWLNFIRAARIRIQQLQEEGNPAREITWMVFSPSYRSRQGEESQDLMGIIRSVRDAYGVRMIPFETADELVRYINAGNGRASKPIVGFEYFGHSNRACFMFDYSNEIDSASKQWLHEDELGTLKRSAFARNAYVKSWGCHTGESMSAKWRQATGTRMIGAIGKTQYQTHDLPALSGGRGRWVD